MTGPTKEQARIVAVKLQQAGVQIDLLQREQVRLLAAIEDVVDGVSAPLRVWADTARLKVQTLRARLTAGESLREAMARPSAGRGGSRSRRAA